MLNNKTVRKDISVTELKIARKKLLNKLNETIVTIKRVLEDSKRK